MSPLWVINEIRQNTSESPEIHTRYSMKYFHQKNNFLMMSPIWIINEIRQNTSEWPEIFTRYSTKYFHQKINFSSMSPLWIINEIRQNTSESHEIYTRYSAKFIDVTLMNNNWDSLKHVRITWNLHQIQYEIFPSNK